MLLADAAYQLGQLFGVLLIVAVIVGIVREVLKRRK
jgi:hypothetical protein